MSKLAAVASLLPLVWVRLYTLGLAASLRTARRAEIASDTYEHVHDTAFAGAPGALMLDIARSLVAGIPDDLRWRATYLSVTGTVGQSLVMALPLAALVAFISYHTTEQAVFALVAALIVEAAAAGVLIGLSYLEVTMNNQETLAGEDLGIERTLTATALITFPALLLVSQLIIPFAGGADPIGDKADLVARAEETNRWVAGYGVLALALLSGIYAMLHLGVVVRHRGVLALGTIGPLLFSIGALGVIVGGPGVVGLGLAQAIDAGFDGTAYLEAQGEAGLVFWWFGSITCAVSLVLIGLAIWRAELLEGAWRAVCLGALALEALSIGLLPGFGGSGWATLPASIVGFVAFGSLALALVGHRAGAGVSRPMAAATFPKS